MKLILILLALYLFFAGGWALFIALMVLKAKRDALHPWVRRLGYSLLVLGYVWDVLLNVIICAAVFRSRPRALLLTGSLKWFRNDTRATNQQARRAAWICENMLNLIAPGHC